jgi:hypothetical protein
VCRPKKQKPEPGQSNLENTSPQAWNTVGLSQPDVEDVFPQAQSTAGPYLIKQSKKDTRLKISWSISQGRNKVTNQHLTLSNQLFVSEAAMGSTASETELPLG